VSENIVPSVARISATTLGVIREALQAESAEDLRVPAEAKAAVREFLDSFKKLVELARRAKKRLEKNRAKLEEVDKYLSRRTNPADDKAVAELSLRERQAQLLRAEIESDESATYEAELAITSQARAMIELFPRCLLNRYAFMLDEIGKVLEVFYQTPAQARLAAQGTDVARGFLSILSGNPFRDIFPEQAEDLLAIAEILSR
jgi:hypothetical protein